MPPKRKYGAVIYSKFAAAKARYSKRARVAPVARIRQNVPFGTGPIPASSVVWLKYTTSISSNGTLFDNMFNLNSIFECEDGISGTQPLGRDQYLTFYNRYRVLKVRAKIMSGVNNAITGDPHLLGIVADNNDTVYGDYDTAIQQQGGYGTIVPSGQSASIFRTFDLAKITGVSAAQYKADDRFQALMTADPTEKIMLHVMYSKVFGGVAANNAQRVRIELWYQVELFDRQQVARST